MACARGPAEVGADVHATRFVRRGDRGDGIVHRRPQGRALGLGEVVEIADVAHGQHEHVT